MCVKVGDRVHVVGRVKAVGAETIGVVFDSNPSIYPTVVLNKDIIKTIPRSLKLGNILSNPKNPSYQAGIIFIHENDAMLQYYHDSSHFVMSLDKLSEWEIVD